MYWFYNNLRKIDFSHSTSKTTCEFEIKLLDQERLRAGRKINEDIIATKVEFIILLFINLFLASIWCSKEKWPLMNWIQAWQRRLAQCSGWIDGRNSTSLSNFTNKSKKKDEKMTKYQRKKGISPNECNVCTFLINKPVDIQRLIHRSFLVSKS